MNLPSSIGTVVIGGSQAGLATGYHLKQHGVEHVILDENDSVGAAWRNRWESLRLFTPGRYCSLPGMPYPGSARSIPDKDDIADYLAAYAARFELPVKTGIRVERVFRDGDNYIVETSEGRIEADNVVAATGAFHQPRIPAFADSLNDNILQMHSSGYNRPSQIPPGDILIVGAGSSGAEIALELARNHRVWLSGRDPGEEPPVPTPVLWFVASRILSVNNPIGRKVRKHFLYPPRGIPRGRVKRKELLRAGIEWVPRTTGTKNGIPELEDGRVLDVSTILWCTGYRTDYSWIELPVFGEYGYPDHDRGVVDAQPGLYFVGLIFQQTVTSTLIGGVGKDAAFIASHIRERMSAMDTRKRVRTPEPAS